MRAIALIAIGVPLLGCAAESTSSGPGFRTCADYLSAPAETREGLDLFLEGVLFGAARERDLSSGNVRQIPYLPGDMRTSFLNFCQSHPSEPFGEAAFALLNDVRPPASD